MMMCILNCGALKVCEVSTAMEKSISSENSSLSMQEYMNFPYAFFVAWQSNWYLRYIEQEIQSLTYTDNTYVKISHIKLILCM
jgi:hypothetical protein